MAIPTAGEVGASLGVRLARIGSQIRETSLARTTPGLTKQVAEVADSMAAQRARVAADRLTGWLEEHASNSPLPPAIGGLFGAIGKLGGWLAQNVYGTAIGFGIGGALSSVMEPYFADMVQSAWSKNPIAALSPAEAAAAVLRGYLEPAEGATEALKSGVDARRFGVMQGLAGGVPALEPLVAQLRRGAITPERFRHAVERAGIHVEWMPEIEQMSIIPPSPIEPLEALLEGQIDEPTARDWYRRLGGLEEWFTIGFNTRGQAPTPVEALDLWNRGIIDENGRGPLATSYEQAFLEGPWRNKWLDAFKALRVYLPPPRTIVTLLRNQAITPAEAIDLLRKQGLTPDLAAAYVDSASKEKTGPERDLAKSEVVSLYEARFIDQAEATRMLEALGFDAHEVELLLALADSRRDRRYQESLIATVHARYVTWKIDGDTAQRALDGLGVPPAQKADLLTLWQAERAIRAPELTLAQAQGAVRRAVWTDAELREWLAQRGYDAREIDVLSAETAPAPRR